MVDIVGVEPTKPKGLNLRGIPIPVTHPQFGRRGRLRTDKHYFLRLVGIPIPITRPKIDRVTPQGEHC